MIMFSDLLFPESNQKNTPAKKAGAPNQNYCLYKMNMVTMNEHILRTIPGNWHCQKNHLLFLPVQ